MTNEQRIHCLTLKVGPLVKTRRRSTSLERKKTDMHPSKKNLENWKTHLRCAKTASSGHKPKDLKEPVAAKLPEEILFEGGRAGAPLDM